MSSTKHTIATAFVTLACLAAAAAQAADRHPLLVALDAPRLRASERHAVHDLVLQVGAGTLTLQQGVVVPAEPLGDRPFEAVFIGRARFAYRPTDDIERGQVEIFSERKELDFALEDAVLVLGNAELMSSLLAGPAPEAAADGDGAAALYDRWLSSAERERAGIRGLILRAAAGDLAYQTVAAAWIDASSLKLVDPRDLGAKELGARSPDRLLALVDPGAPESFSLTHFVPALLTRQERFELGGAIADAQSRGHSFGVLDDLREAGWTDTWSLTMAPGPGGRPWRGSEGVEPEHYALDVTVANSGDELHGQERVTLSVEREVRTLRLRIHPDLKVVRAAGTDGREFSMLQAKGEVIVLLPEPLAAGARYDLTVEWRGTVLEKLRRGEYTSWSNTDWYPHTGTADWATYECTYHWPKKVQLIAAGRRVEAGETGDASWERRVVERRVNYIGFELGKFEVVETRAGRTQIKVAFCRESQAWLSGASEEKFARNAVAALEFYEKLYGAYPFDELDIVTTPPSSTVHFSRALPGLVTVLDDELQHGDTYGVRTDVSDYRMVLAHQIAHQWWGMLAHAESYHDRWLIEGMAEYAALRFGREIASKGKEFVSPTKWGRYWLRSRTGSGGRPIDWFGPVVLGFRLDSTHCRGCGTPVIYSKGAMILDLLASTVGEENFDKSMVRLLEESRERPVTTSRLIANAADGNGVTLDWFRDQFIRGVGMPLLFYSYEFEKREAGWRIRVRTEQMPDWISVFHVVRRPDGGFDLEERPVVREGPAHQLVMPFRLDYFRPDDPQLTDANLEKRARRIGNYSRRSAVRVPPGTNTTDLSFSYEPRRFRLDPDGSTPVLVEDETAHPRDTLRVRAVQRQLAGDLDGAEKLATQALSAEPPEFINEILHEEAVKEFELAGGFRGSAGPVETTVNKRFSDLRAHVILGEVRLGQDNLQEARAELKEAQRLEDRTVDKAGSELIVVLEARILLREKNAEKAYGLAWKRVFDGEAHGAAAWAIGAIAARLKGDDISFEKARDHCRRMGVDITPLLAPAGESAAARR